MGIAGDFYRIRLRILARQDFQAERNAEHLFKCILQFAGIVLGDDFPLKICVDVNHHLAVFNPLRFDTGNPNVIGHFRNIVPAAQIIQDLRPGFFDGFHFALLLVSVLGNFYVL